MLSVWSSSSRQRSINASSISSISSKSPFWPPPRWLAPTTSPLAVAPGSPRAGTQDVSRLGSQPLCRCASRPDLPPKGRACALRLLPLFGELIECHREQLHIDRGQD